MIPRYAPALACAEPTPVDDACTCSCRNGVVYNTTRPDFSGSILPPPVNGNQIDGKPCTAEIIIPWTQVTLPHKYCTLEPSTIGSQEVDIPDDSVFLVADSEQRCQHYEVYINGQHVGETSGTGELDGFRCGSGEECMEKHGGSYAYFKILKGKAVLLDFVSSCMIRKHRSFRLTLIFPGHHTIGLKWIKVTDACKDIANGNGSFQIYKPCHDTQTTV